LGLGSGKIGGTVAKLFLNAGHEIAISNSRGPQSLQLFVESLGSGAKAMTVEDSIAFGDNILLQCRGGREKDYDRYHQSYLRTK
jgi:predicted dinucleotide-binding enzyme